MRKIIFSDYDGTLNTSKEDIAKNIAAIKIFRQRGNLFTIATGRSYLSLKEELNLYSIPFDYLIVNHGSVILDKNEKVIDACFIPEKIAVDILNTITSNESIEKVMLFNALESDIIEVSDKLTKILLGIKNIESAKNLSEFINNRWTEYVKTYVIPTEGDYLVEIISRKTDKGKAIEKILELEDIDANNVFPIGDGSNDIEMILKYNGYGMKKSEDIVYTVTSKICNTVAELIEILNERED